MGSLREMGPGRTTADFRALPEGTRCQLIGGELIMSPSPRFFHQRIVLRLAHLMLSFLDRHPGVGTVVAAPMDVYLTETDAYQPDVVFVADGGRATVEDDGVHGPPELVIEVLSPGSVQYDLGRKKRVYQSCGVVEYWVVDPDARCVQVFRFQESTEASARVYREGDTLESTLLPGLRIEVAEAFRM